MCSTTTKTSALHTYLWSAKLGSLVTLSGGGCGDGGLHFLALLIEMSPPESEAVVLTRCDQYAQIPLASGLHQEETMGQFGSGR